MASGHLEKLTFSERAIWMEGRPAGFVARDRNGSAWFLRSRRALSRSRCQEGPAGFLERGCALGGFPRAVERGLAQAGGGAEERGRTQAPDASPGRKPRTQAPDASLGTRSSSSRRWFCRRSTISLTTRSSTGRVSDPRPALVDALPGAGPCGSGARRDDSVAVSREARASGAGRGAV